MDTANPKTSSELLRPAYYINDIGNDSKHMLLCETAYQIQFPEAGRGIGKMYALIINFGRHQ